ncbi:MAG TPA: DUF1905 domain-containing protein [Hyphomonadaceae bacterium]|nr:DUF1905 domain-containing protein [Hyphomonadaceae bacterium]
MSGEGSRHQERIDHLKYSLDAKVWVYPGPGAWRFVTVPQDLSRRIEAMAPGPRPAFGSVRVTATVGATTWATSLFPDKRTQGFLLPLKADVRKREKIFDGDVVTIVLSLEL